MLTDPRYHDDGALRDQDRVAVHEYLASGDRTKTARGGTPFFSGRESEVSRFRHMANALSLGLQGDATLAIHGPPGAGKSALLAQFAEEMRHLPPTEDGGRRWLPVVLDGAVATSPLEVSRSIDAAIARRLARDVLDARPDARAGPAAWLNDFLGREGGVLDVARGIQERGFSAMGFSLAPKGRADRPESIQEVCHDRAREWSKWQVVLLIDEAQNIPATHPGTLSAIHQGLAGGAISFCAFGLPGTLAALQSAGVSRLSGGHAFRLGGLDERECGMVVDRCFAAFGIEDAGAWRAAILSRLDGWPQHLNGYLTSACSVLGESRPGSDRLAPPNDGLLRKAVVRGDQAREGRYRDRVDSLNAKCEGFDEFARLLVPLFERTQGRPLKSEVRECLAHGAGLGDERMAGFLSAAHRCGIIDEAPADARRYAMPIPSLAGYLAGRPLPPPALNFG